MSTLFAFSKARLYDVDSTSDEVYAATYMGAMSWKSSISYKEQSLIREDYRTFNNLITPARPQEPEDVSKPALFVMKVCVWGGGWGVGSGARWWQSPSALIRVQYYYAGRGGMGSVNVYSSRVTFKNQSLILEGYRTVRKAAAGA
jgi:hypothetical protein